MTNEAKLQKTAAPKPKKRKRGVSLDAKKARAGWLFILPFAVGFLLIYLPIIFDSIRYSFYRIEILAGGGYNLIPVGFENYRQALFVDPDFVTTLLSGLKELAFDIPAIIIFSLFMAVLLNQKFISSAYEKTDGNVISSAMSWMYFLIVMLIIALVAGILSAFVFYQRRD